MSFLELLYSDQLKRNSLKVDKSNLKYLSFLLA